MKKWYHCYTESRLVRNVLRWYLHENGFAQRGDYALSECGDGWHFDIYATILEAQKIGQLLDVLYEKVAA